MKIFQDEGEATCVFAVLEGPVFKKLNFSPLQHMITNSRVQPYEMRWHDTPRGTLI